MRLTEQVHLELTRILRPGDIVIDATAGNGHDTLAMAKLVGPTGKVIATDLQPEAIQSTRACLDKAGQLQQCELIEGNHAEVLTKLEGRHRERVAAITFNLGYLPGSTKEVTTQPESTLQALGAAASLLRPGALLFLVAYRGHSGGREEADRVAAWMRALPVSDWRVEVREPAARDPLRIPPILWVARKAARPVED